MKSNLPPGPNFAAENFRRLANGIMGRQYDPVANFGAMFEKYGDIVYVNAFGNRFYLLRDPRMIERPLITNFKNYKKGFGLGALRLVMGDGLITSDQDTWHRQRRMIQPVFHNENLVKKITLFDELAKGWVGHRLNEGTIESELGPEMASFAVEALCRTIMGTCNPLPSMQIYSLIETALDLSNKESASVGRLVKNYLLKSRISLLRGVAQKAVSSTQKQLNEVMGKLDETMWKVISSPSEESLLQNLRDARDSRTGEQMTVQQLRDEIMTLFVAGQETTATALSWTLYALAKNPVHYKRVLNELRAIPNDALPDSFEKFFGFAPYLMACILESLRLYPPIWRFPRCAIQDDEVGGYHVPAGTNLVLFSYFAHRHPGHWKDPESFEPARFMGEAADKMHKCAFFPFSAGPRTCIGNNFALIEMVIFLRRALNALDFCIDESQLATPLSFQSKLSLFPKQAFRLKITRRAG